MTSNEAIRPLPARAVPSCGESLTSLVRQTAQSMGYENPERIRSLLTEVGDLPANLNQLSAGPALDRLAGLLHRAAADVLGMTFHRFAAQLVLVPRGSPSPAVCDSRTILKYFVTSAAPVCPVCLREAQAAFEQLAWSFRALPVCVSHGCLLIGRCPACRRPLRHDRKDASRCPCGCLLDEASSQRVSSHVVELERMFARLLMEGTTLLPEMSTAATFWWAERLAAAAAKAAAWMEGFAARMEFEPGQMTGCLPWLAAAEILKGWPDRFEEFLEVFQGVVKHRTTATGVSRRFGLLLREAAYLEQIGYPMPADALRDYLLRHYTAGHLNGKVCLFQGRRNQSLLAKRPWITQTQAAGVLRIRQGAIAPLVARGILAGEIHAAGQHGRSVGLVRRDSVEVLQVEVRTALDVRTTANRLGIGRHAVLDLIHADLLPRAVRTAKGWQIPQQSVADWEESLTRLPRSKGELPGWISLRQATRVAGPSGLALSQFLQLIRAGSLPARMADSLKGLNGVLVSRAHLAVAQDKSRNADEPSMEWTLHRAARSLFPGRPLKAYVLKRWIRGRLLRAHRKGRRTLIAAAEIRRFRAEYCLAQEAAQMLGISRSTLSRWELQGRIVPVYGKRVTPQAGFSLYRRQDLDRLSKRAA